MYCYACTTSSYNTYSVYSYKVIYNFCPSFWVQIFFCWKGFSQLEIISHLDWHSCYHCGETDFQSLCTGCGMYLMHWYLLLPIIRFLCWAAFVHLFGFSIIYGIVILDTVHFSKYFVHFLYLYGTWYTDIRHTFGPWLPRRIFFSIRKCLQYVTAK